MAESLLLIVLLTPSKALLRLSKERMKSAMPLFTLQGLNKSISVKICQKDPFSIIWFSLAADKLITLVAKLWTSSAWKRPGSCPGPSWCKWLSPWSPWAWSWGRWCPCCWRRTSLSVSPWSDGPWPWWGQDGSYSAIFFLVFGPRNLERHPQLFHVNKIVSHPLRALVDHKQEGWCFKSFFICGQKLNYPSFRLLCSVKAKWRVECVVLVKAPYARPSFPTIKSQFFYTASTASAMKAGFLTLPSTQKCLC